VKGDISYDLGPEELPKVEDSGVGRWKIIAASLESGIERYTPPIIDFDLNPASQ